jgi:hypothetical protein
MSLKDEIDKLISAERNALEKQAIESRTYHEKEKTHFLPLRAVLEDMIEAIDPAYLRIRLEDDRATIKMGARNDNNHDADLSWMIVSGWPDDLPEEQELLEELRIFTVIESRRNIVYPDSYITESCKIETAEEVVQYLLKKVAKQIAKYQQVEVEESSRKRNSKDRS